MFINYTALRFIISNFGYIILKNILMHLKSFKTFESDERDLTYDLQDLGMETYKGWVVCTLTKNNDDIGVGITAIVAKNVGEAGVLMCDQFGVDTEDELEKAAKIESLEDIDEIFNDIFDYDTIFMVEKVYEGLQPISMESTSLEIDWINPVMAVKDLKSMFRNVDQVMGSGFSEMRR
jgi:hypothetical protein